LPRQERARNVSAILQTLTNMIIKKIKKKKADGLIANSKQIAICRLLIPAHGKWRQRSKDFISFSRIPSRTGAGILLTKFHPNWPCQRNAQASPNGKRFPRRCAFLRLSRESGEATRVLRELSAFNFKSVPDNRTRLRFRDVDAAASVTARVQF